jgi:hypothetical protein
MNWIIWLFCGVWRGSKEGKNQKKRKCDTNPKEIWWDIKGQQAHTQGGNKKVDKSEERERERERERETAFAVGELGEGTCWRGNRIRHEANEFTAIATFKEFSFHDNETEFHDKKEWKRREEKSRGM